MAPMAGLVDKVLPENGALVEEGQLWFLKQ